MLRCEDEKRLVGCRCSIAVRKRNVLNSCWWRWCSAVHAVGFGAVGRCREWNVDILYFEAIEQWEKTMSLVEIVMDYKIIDVRGAMLGKIKGETYQCSQGTTNPSCSR